MSLELYINSEKVDLSPAAVIAITKQIVDIATFSTVKGDRSNSITLPATDTNKRIVEYANQVQSQTGLPYTRIPAKAIQDGVDVLPNAYCAIDTVEGGIKVALFAGNISWASLLDGKTLRMLDYTGDTHIWNLANIIATHTTPLMNYLYPIINYRVDEQAMLGLMIPDILRPHIYFRSLLNKIFNEIGYTIEGDIFNNPRFDGAHLECSRIEYPLELMLAEAIVDDPAGYIPISQNPFALSEAWLRFPTEVHDPLQAYSPPGVIEEVTTITGLRFQYNCKKAGKYYFRLAMHLVHVNAQFGATVYPGSNPIPYVIKASSAMGTELGYFASGVPTVFEFSVVIPTDNFPLQFFLTPPLSYISGGGPNLWNVNLMNDTDIQMVGFEGESTTSIGDVVNPAYLLPEYSQAEWVKSVAFMFGQAIIPDAIQKKIVLRSWSELQTNKPRAVDWSRKVDRKEKKIIDFRLAGWSQHNWFKYAEDETVLPGWGDGELVVPDQWLPFTRDVITMPFSAATNDNDGIPLIPRATKPDIVWLWTGDSNARVCSSAMNAGSITIGGTPVSPYRESWFKKTNGTLNIGFDDSLLIDFYNFILGMVRNPKLVTAPMKLSLVDIQSFDHFIPVYIDEDSAYYFVNKIGDWIKNKNTKVQLIRL